VHNCGSPDEALVDTGTPDAAARAITQFATINSFILRFLLDPASVRSIQAAHTQ
jgi:hypothetical protein